jgi:hypothetical protein
MQTPPDHRPGQPNPVAAKPAQSPPLTRPKRLRIGVGVGAALLCLGFGVGLWELIGGEEVPVYNDGPARATIEVQGAKVTVEPGAWAALRLRSGSSYAATASFADGSRSSWTIDMIHGPNYANVRAYAAGGTDCFTLLDVSKIYDAGSNPVRVLATFQKTHVLEKRVEYATVLPPGDLPKNVTFNRSFSTLVWMRPVACEAVTTEEAVRKLERELNTSLKKRP